MQLKNGLCNVLLQNSSGNLDDQELCCECQDGNAHDSFAVAICTDDTVVGHVPRTLSSSCILIFKHGRFFYLLHSNTRRTSGTLHPGTRRMKSYHSQVEGV